MKYTLLCLVALFAVALAEITPIFPSPQPLIIDPNSAEYTPPDYYYYYDFEEKIVIDDFSFSGSPLVVTIPSGGAPPTLTQSTFDDSNSILGGQREYQITVTNAAAGRVVSAGVSNGQFTLTLAQSAGGSCLLQYDGDDGGSMTLSSTTGFGPLDFTAAGSAFGIVFSAFSDLDTTVVITICSSGGACDAAELDVPEGNVVVDYIIDFDEFAVNVDFTAVTAIEFNINPDRFDNVNFILESIAVIGDVNVITVGGSSVCASVPPCETYYYRIQTLTDVHPEDYLKVTFNTTGEAPYTDSLASMYFQGSQYNNLENELLTNDNILSTLGELPSPTNYLYKCDADFLAQNGGECEIEITYFLENTTYYIAVSGGETGISDFCIAVFLREVEIIELEDRVQVPIFFDQRATLPPDDRALTYTFYEITVDEATYFSEGTFLYFELSRVQPFPGLGMQVMFGGLPELEVDEGVIGYADDFDSNGRDVDDSIYDYCVNTTSCYDFDYPVIYQERQKCYCFTDIQIVGDGPAFQLTCSLTVDPCKFQYGTWYVSVGPLPAREEPYDAFDTSGFANYTILAKVVQPLVTTMFRDVTFKGFVEPERLTHYKINVPASDMVVGQTHLLTTISNVRNGMVNVWVHQGLGPTMNLAGIEGCVPSNATCQTSAACNVVIEKCHFVPGTWYIAVGVAYDPETCSFGVCDWDRLPITYTLKASWQEDGEPQRLLAGVPVSKAVGEALYDFYVVDVPPTIDTWLFVELFAKAEDTEVIISMLHGDLPGGECYARPDFYCLTGDPRGENPMQRESCQFMIQTCELEAGPLYISVYGHHVGYAAYGDNTYYQVPVHYTLWVDFDVALAIGSGEVYTENVFQNQYQHYYIRADDVDQGSFLTVEVTNIQHGIPQTVEAFVNYNFLAGNCPCYDHLYNCTGAQNPGCNGNVGADEPNFLPEPDSVATCCTIVVPPSDFRSGVWYISVMGINEDLVQYTTPIGYTLTVTINPAPVFNPLILGQADVNTVPQWNKTLQYTNYKLAATPYPLNDLVLKISYVQNCEYNEKHDNLRDTLTMYVNMGAPASMFGYDMYCEANVQSWSYCTITIPHCMWTSNDIFIAIQGNYDAVLPARYTLRAYTEEIRDVQLTANVPHYDRISEGRYNHYFIEMAGNEDQYLAIDIYTNQDQDPITAYLNYESRAGDAPCFTNMASCWSQTSCWWQLEACEINAGRYYISVYGNSHQFYDIATEYTVTAYVKTVTSRLGNGDPVTGTIQVGEIQHYKYTVAEVVDGDYLLFEIDNVQHGSVVVYQQFGYLAGRCPCYLFEQSCYAASDEECGWCDIRIDPCQLQVGDYFFSVVGVENMTPTPPMYQTAIGYTIEVNQLRPSVIVPQVDVGRNVANTETFQFIANGRYNHYQVSVDDDDFSAGYHLIVEITSVRDGALFVYYQPGFPADESCHLAKLCTSGLGAGKECYWQIPYCLSRPTSGTTQYISVEGVTGRLQASYSILIWKQPVPSIIENPDFTLDNVTSSVEFPGGAELNVTHYYQNEPNGWTQFFRLEDVVHSDPLGGDILELFFYRINNNENQPTSFNVYIAPREPAGAHECCSGTTSDIGACQNAPCAQTVDTTTQQIPDGAEVFTHTCSLPTGLGVQPETNNDPFYGYRCTVRVWACEFNKYCSNETIDWWVSVVPIAPSDATPDQDLPGLSYSVQWRTRATRTDEEDDIDSINLNPIVNLYEYSQEYTMFNPDTDTEDFLSFYVDMNITDGLSRRLIVQTDFPTGEGVVYIKRSTTQEFANPTQTCYEYECAWNDGFDTDDISWCANDGRFIVSDCCSINEVENGGRWWITVRNTGPELSTASVRFRITIITQPGVIQIEDHPSYTDPFITGSGSMVVPGGTVPGLQGEKYDFYAIIMDDDDLDDHESLIIEMARTEDPNAGPVSGYLNIYIRFGAEAGDYNGYHRDYYNEPEECYMWQYMCTAANSDDRCIFQIPACQMLEGYWYISIFNPEFDFGPDTWAPALPEYELIVYVQDSPVDLTLNQRLDWTDEAYTNNPPGTYMHLRVNVTAADIEYDDRSVLEGYYTNWLRFQVGNLTSGTVTMWVNYGDLAGNSDDYVCLDNFNACSGTECFIDVFPCPFNDQKLLSGEYFIALEFSQETEFDIEALVLSNEYDQILVTDTIAGTGADEGTTTVVYQHSVTSSELNVDGDTFGHYRYVIDLTDAEGDDDGFPDYEYVTIYFNTDDDDTNSDTLDLQVWRDDCTRWSCDLIGGEDTWCVIDAIGLAPCTLKGGRFYFDVYNPSANFFNLTLELRQATIQELGQDVVITEDTEPYKYQQYVWQPFDLIECATLEIEICSICGDVEAWLRPDAAAGPDDVPSHCNIDYGRTNSNRDEFEFDDDVDCFSFFLDTCEYEDRPYYVGVRGVIRSFPNAQNDDLITPIRYQITAHQTNCNVTDIDFQCPKTLAYYESWNSVPRQYTVDLESVNVGESLRFSMKLPWEYVPAEDATMYVQLNHAAGYTPDCPNWSPYWCSTDIESQDYSCDFIIPACEAVQGRYYIWADAPRGTQILVERFDPYIPMLDQNLWYSATINAPAMWTTEGSWDYEWDLPYRPARQYYRVDILPPGYDDSDWLDYYEKFFVRVRVADVDQGSISVSVNSGYWPAVDEFGADCGTPVFWDNYSCQMVEENEECTIDIELWDVLQQEHTVLPQHADDDDGHFHTPTTYWIVVSGVEQECELHSIKYSFVVQTNWVLTYYDLNTTICNSVKENEYNFHRLRPRTGESPQETVLRIDISDIDVNVGEEVEFLLKDGYLATKSGADLAIRSGRDAEDGGGIISTYWYCGYNDLYMSVYGINAEDNCEDIEYRMGVYKESVPIRELFYDSVFHMDDDDDDMCPHQNDFFIFKAVAPNGGFRTSFLRVAVDSDCPVEVWVNKHTIAWGPCHDTAHGTNGGSGTVNLYDFCDYEDTFYYITVQSECHYYIYTDIRDDAKELTLGEVFRDELEPGMYQMYTLEVCEDWFESDDRLVVEITDVENGGVYGWIQRNSNPGPIFELDDDEIPEEGCSLATAYAEYGEAESGYDFLLVDTTHLVAGTYHILIRAAPAEWDDFDDDDCEHTTYRLYPYLVDYEINPMDLPIGEVVSGALDMYRVDRFETDALRQVDHYTIMPYSKAEGYMDFVSFAQVRVANVQGGDVMVRVMCGHLASPQYDYINGSRQALTQTGKIEGFEIQSGRRPWDYQLILDPYTSWINPQCTGAADYCCQTGAAVGDATYEQSCAIEVPSCYWDIKDWVMFFVSVEVISQDYEDHPVTYDLVVDQYEDFTLIQPNTNRIGSFSDNNWEYDFYWSLQADVESARWRVVVTEGEGVLVTVRNHRCPLEATWEKTIWCDADYWDHPWMCDIEIPTRASHPGDMAFFVTVMGKDATYSIAYWRGRENCHEFSGTGRADGLDFCSGLVPYATWRWDDYSRLDGEAECFFEELYEHFRVQPCWSGVTPECNSTLQRFACYESFRSCDEDGFYVGTCRKACEAVVYECVNWFESVDLEHYNCTSSRYLDDDVETCTGSSLFANYAPNTVTFLGNPDLLLFAPSPDSYTYKDSASTLTMSFVLLIASILIAVL